MSYSFNQDKNICTIKLDGTITTEQMLHFFKLAVQDERYLYGMSRLWDFRDADMTHLSPDGLMAMAEALLDYPKGVDDVKVAYVTKEKMQEEFIDMFNAFGSYTDLKINFFTAIDTAEDWLGI